MIVAGGDGFENPQVGSDISEKKKCGGRVPQPNKEKNPGVPFKQKLWKKCGARGLV